MMNVYLKSGEAYFSDKPTQVTTVLGSCVAVTMFDKSKKVGAICHGILPKYEGSDRPMFMMNNECLKFVDCAVAKMAKAFDARGISRKDVEVKVFGGAEMFSGCADSPVIPVGRKNVEQARMSLEKEGFRVGAWDTGGAEGRKMFFYTHTGVVILKRLG